MKRFSWDKHILVYFNGGDVSYWIEGKGKKPVLVVTFNPKEKVRYTGHFYYRKIVYLSLTKPKYIRKAKFTKAEKESFLKVYDFKYVDDENHALGYGLKSIKSLDYSNLETKD